MQISPSSPLLGHQSIALDRQRLLFSLESNAACPRKAPVDNPVSSSHPSPKEKQR